MALSITQQTSSFSASPTFVGSVATNARIAVVVQLDTPSSFAGITCGDNKGNAAYTKHVATSNGAAAIAFFTGKALTGGSSFQVQVANYGSATSIQVTIFELPTAALDLPVIFKSNTGNSTTLTPSSIRIPSEDYISFNVGGVAAATTLSAPAGYSSSGDSTHTNATFRVATLNGTALDMTENPSMTSGASAAWADFIAVIGVPCPYPYFVGAGSPGAGVGAVSPTINANTQLGDLLVLLVESAGTPGSAPDGTWTQFPDSPQDQGTTTALEAYYKPHNGDAAPSVADRGDHAYAVILTFGNVRLNTPYDVTNGGTEGADTSLSMTGDTTTVPNCLVIGCASNDIATGAHASAQANADLTAVGSFEIFDNGTTQGADGAISVMAGRKATAGAFGASTATVTSGAKAWIVIALAPPTPPKGNQPNATGTLAKKRLKSLAGAQPAGAGTIAADSGTVEVDLAGAQPAATGTIASLRSSFVALAGAQPAATGALSFLRTYFAAVAGNQPAGSGTIAAVRLVLVALAGSQAAASGALASLRTAFKSLAGAQPAGSGALSIQRLLTHIALAGSQAAATGAVAVRWLFRSISLAGAQPAATGEVSAVSAQLIDLSGSQPAATGSLVVEWIEKHLTGDQPAGTGLIYVFVSKTISGNQPAATGELDVLAVTFDYSPSPNGMRARITSVRPVPGGVSAVLRPKRGNARLGQ